MKSSCSKSAREGGESGTGLSSGAFLQQRAFQAKRDASSDGGVRNSKLLCRNFFLPSRASVKGDRSNLFVAVEKRLHLRGEISID